MQNNEIILHSDDLVKEMHCKLPVDKEKSRTNFFNVYTEEDDFNIPKLKFQKDQKLPDYLDIYVKDAKDGYYFIGQDLASLIPLFYEEGKEYSFKIKGKKSGKTGAYDVEDENGLYFNLYNAPEGLLRGKSVKCKVVKINKVYVQLKYSGLLSQKMNMPFRSLTDWLTTAGLARLHSPIRNLLESNSDFAIAISQHEEREPSWFLTVLSQFSQGVTKYLISSKDNPKSLRLIRKMMKLAIDLCLYIIQGSDYLRDCHSEQRTELQKQLSGYVEMFKQFDEAAYLISNHLDEAFIDEIFENLKRAGFLYHPSKQFRIMMTILRLRPDLIRSRLASLFEALHSWPLSNWKSEPFRSALVDQLEIYISENCNLLNTLAPHTDGETPDANNKQLTHIIRSIAIQSMLATPKDKIDMSHNKAMFYRFLSGFRTDNVDDLLYKAVGAIMGNDYAHDFTWEDTSRFQMLQEKAATFKGSNREIKIPPKVFMIQNASVELRPNELTIREKYTTEDDSVLPNGLINWMAPKVFLRESVHTPNAGKKNDLKAYDEMWSDIENAIFPSTNKDAAKEVDIRKRLPDDGDEVEIMIDDCIVDHERSIGHQLRFHCVIVSDIYEGEGWLTSCPEDFISWLDEKDYPMNYSGNTSVFNDDRGIPLLFPAKVKNSGQEMHFTMKKEIEQHLLDMAALNETSHATIRHIDSENNRYICLSDRGYSLLVPFDETNRGYQRGSHVQVRYLGLHRDRYNSQTQFMDGQIVEFLHDPYESYSKEAPLRGIMQTLGREQTDYTDDSETGEVVEAQEVMSREEMREIVLMLQQKAYAEKEYIQAFNYLGFGALLARTIEDNGLYDEMKLHQKLLTQLQFYARNRSVDREELLKHKDQVAGHAILQKLYTRLDIVSSISRPEYNTRLWELTTQDDETEKLLASLVLSLNLIPEDERFEKSRKELNGEIAKILNVNSSEVKLKYYGEEDQHMEFKSSLVFTNRKEDHMAARQDAQEREILEIICGFLNSYGGTLYIGVNDSGYEAGLEEDRRYRRSRGRKDTLDAMIVDLDNLINRKLDGYAHDNIQISSDPESVKGVIKVEVHPVERPVALDGLYYVRNSSSTRPKLEKDLEDFLSMRRQNYNDYMIRRRQAAEEIRVAMEEEKRQFEEEERLKKEKEEAEALRMVSGRNRPIETEEVPEEGKATDDHAGKAETGHHRLNALHDYDPGFTHPAFYLHFNDDNTLYTTHEDQYKEFDEDKRLILAVSEKESDSHYLISTFADGTVCKTELSEIAGLEKDHKYEHHSGTPLIAANIADKDDLLLSFVTNPSNNYLYVRVDSIDDIHTSHYLRSEGKRLTDLDYKIVYQDIISKEKADFLFPKIADNSRKLHGSIVKFSNQNESAQDRINFYVGQIAASVD